MARGWTKQESFVRRRLRLIVGVFTALLWVDNVTEHYRGGFEKKLMWVPVVANPVVAATAIASAVSPRPLWRRGFAALSAAQAVIALTGFIAHQRGIQRQPGSGSANYLFHAWYGPPVAAPLQYLGFSVLGLIATLPHHVMVPLLRVLPLHRLLRLFMAVNVPPLWGEVAYLHARAAFQDPFQWLPVVALPAAGGAAAAATFSSNDTIRVAHVNLARTVVALGAAGTGFHILGMARRYKGLDRKVWLFSWLSGPPVPAPLQLIGLGWAVLAGEKAARR